METDRSSASRQESGSEATSSEAVAVFHTAEALQEAVDKLMDHGFSHAAISVLASEQAIAAKLGRAYQSTTELEEDPDVPRAIYVPDESIGAAQGAVIAAAAYFPAVIGSLAVAASGGTLLGAVAVAAIAGGAGAGAGAVLGRFIGREHAAHLDEHIRHGGLLLWVRTPDPGHERTAIDVLRRCGGADVHLHEMQPAKRLDSIPTRRPLVSLGPAA
jgi:hypothetical protein